MKILITDGFEAAPLAKLKEEHDVTVAEMSPEELLSSISGYDALIVRSRTRVTKEVLEAASNLKVIGRAGAGVDNIDVKSATAKGVMVVNAPASNSISVVELAMGLMLSCVRRLPQAHASMSVGKWEKKAFKGSELFEKTVGIVGYGKIGREVGKRALAFDMKVLAFDPYLTTEQVEKTGATLVEMKELVAKSDIITIHTPLTAKTKALIGKDELASAKDGVIVINTARGGIVDEVALDEALKSGKVSMAAVDVYSKEPPADNALTKNPKIIMTPHIGASTKEAQVRAGMTIGIQVSKVLKGEAPEFLVNKELGK